MEVKVLLMKSKVQEISDDDCDMIDPKGKLGSLVLILKEFDAQKCLIDKINLMNSISGIICN